MRGWAKWVEGGEATVKKKKNCEIKTKSHAPITITMDEVKEESRSEQDFNSLCLMS